MTTPKELRAALEKSQQESRALRATVSELTAKVELLEAQLQQSRGEQERLTRLLLKDQNPTKQKSAFSVEQVPALVAYLKKK
jgi:multidrug resistance efflux pump